MIISNFFIFIFLTWASNLLLNALYVLKKYKPRYVSLDRPIDFGRILGGKRLIGDSTTFFGFFLSAFFSFLIYFTTYSIGLSSIPLLVYLGHTLGSVIKRRFGYKGGQFMPVVDHGDYIIVTSLVLVLTQSLPLRFALAGIVLTYIVHPVVCFISFNLKLREHPW